MKTSKILIAFVYLLFSSLLFVQCSSHSEDEHDHSEHSEEKNEHDENGEEHGKIHLSLEKQKIAGVTIVSAKKGKLNQIIKATGTISQDTKNTEYVFPNVSGTVKKIFINVGDKVKKGQKLFLVGNKTITAKKSGTVISIHIGEGESVRSLTSLAAIADTTKMRAVIDIYPSKVDSIKLGSLVEISPISEANESFTGKVSYISSQIDPHTQTIKVTANIENKHQHLKFGMFINAKIHVPGNKEALLIPKTSVQTIEGKKVVFVQESDDEFEISEVVLGQDNGESFEVLKGIKEGQKLVSNGSFVLKSELSKGELGEEGHSH